MGVSRAIKILALTFALMAMCLGIASAAPGPTFVESTVAANSLAAQTNPEMDGRYVVFEQKPILAGTDSDIVAYNIQTGTPTNLSDPTDNDISQINPDIAGSLVVWQSPLFGHPQVFIHDILWGSTQQLTSKASNLTTPRISGHQIVWHDSVEDSLWWHDYFTPQYENYEVLGSVGAEPGAFDIDCDRIVFAKQSGGDYDIYMWTIGESQTEKIYTLAATEVTQLRLHWDTMAISYENAGPHVDIVNTRTGERTNSSTQAAGGDVFHDRRGWENRLAGNISISDDNEWSTSIGGFDAIAETEPAVFGSRFAYVRESGAGDVYLSSTETEVERIFGANRYETAVRVSEEYFAASNKAVLCTGENFPDALSAAPWARHIDAPLLLTPRDKVPQSVMNELARLGVVQVWIVGGDSVVSSAVTKQLSDAGYVPRRELQGTDRYETSAKIAQYLHAAQIADGGTPSDTAYFARGDSFADALAVSPVAASQYSPILLVKTDSLPAATMGALQSMSTKYGVIVGGTDVVGPNVEIAIETILTANLGSNSPASRWDGPDRYATAVQVVDSAVKSHLIDMDTVVIATGLNFPDALGAGAAMGSYGSPILLTAPGTLPASVKTLLTQSATQIGRVDFVGGSDVVSDAVKTTVSGVLQ